jgi:hypothetical protein
VVCHAVFISIPVSHLSYANDSQERFTVLAEEARDAVHSKGQVRPKASKKKEKSGVLAASAACSRDDELDPKEKQHQRY